MASHSSRGGMALAPTQASGLSLPPTLARSRLPPTAVGGLARAGLALPPTCAAGNPLPPTALNLGSKHLPYSLDHVPLPPAALLHSSGTGGHDNHLGLPPTCLSGIPAPPASLLGRPQAVLECIHVLGLPALARLPASTRTVPLPLDTAIGLGRREPKGFFQGLLGGEAYWLTFISRTHCRLTLSRAADGQFCLDVENLSPNGVLVCGNMLGQGVRDTLPEGGTLTFLGVPEGGTGVDPNAPQSQLMQFMLRRSA